MNTVPPRRTPCHLADLEGEWLRLDEQWRVAQGEELNVLLRQCEEARLAYVLARQKASSLCFRLQHLAIAVAVNIDRLAV